jgi:type I restriction enzyme S subunit
MSVAIRSLRIALPPIEEQKQILEKIDIQISQIVYMEIEIDKQLKRAERLRQSILKKAFSGKLVKQDQNNTLEDDISNKINIQ